LQVADLELVSISPCLVDLNSLEIRWNVRWRVDVLSPEFHITTSSGILFHRCGVGRLDNNHVLDDVIYFARYAIIGCTHFVESCRLSSWYLPLMLRNYQLEKGYQLCGPLVYHTAAIVAACWLIISSKVNHIIRRELVPAIMIVTRIKHCCFLI